MIDVHCHLDLYPDPLVIAKECEKRNIYTIGVTNLPSHFEKGMNHLRAFKRVRLALGMHPLYAARHKNEFSLFSKYISHTSYIGEIGLDFSKEGFPTKSLQVESFEFVLKQLQSAPKIISLHSKGAEYEVLEFLNRYKQKLAIFHWYSGPLPIIDEIVQAGYMFSVNPAMVRSTKGQKIIRKIPLLHVLTETDGPFVQLYGRPVKPEDIVLVESYLAALHQKSLEEISDILLSNFKRLIEGLSTKS